MPTKFDFSSLHQWPRHCTFKARKIVMNIIDSSKTPLATRDIYNLAIKPGRASIPAPHPGEPIRSMRYLKTVVLRDLAAQNLVEKVRVQDAFTAWLWKVKRTSPVCPIKTKAVSLPPGSTELTPAAVGVGEDWSHLNKRRQRARTMKVERDLQRMQEVQKMQRRVTSQ